MPGPRAPIKELWEFQKVKKKKLNLKIYSMKYERIKMTEYGKDTLNGWKNI